MGGFTRISLGLAVAASVAVAPALAQTVTQAFSSSQTVLINSGLGGWTVNVTGCLLTLNGGATPCYNNAEVVASLSHNTLSLAFEGAGGGALETTSSGKLSDLTASILLTPPGGNFWQATATVSGGSTGGSIDFSRITVSDSNLTASYGSAVGPSTTLANSPTLATAVFAPTPTLAGNVDIKSQGGGILLGPSAGTLTLNSATLTYSVPEPVSSSLLAIGLAGLGFVRRRRR